VWVPITAIWVMTLKRGGNRKTAETRKEDVTSVDNNEKSVAVVKRNKVQLTKKFAALNDTKKEERR
ncbi:hypothetical protein HAX54_002127, partial [Datura stramonium]|nr:hypothetical protein [Datura stramonium]